jgi:hypothetical protein
MGTSVMTCKGVSSSTVMALPLAKRTPFAVSDEEKEDSPPRATGGLLGKEAAG